MPETPAAGSPTPGAGTGPGAPADAPGSAIPQDTVEVGRIEVSDAPLPGEEGDQPAGAPGALPADVHPAVREERERARRYREHAEQAFVFDANGEIVGIREDFAQQIVERLGGARPSDAVRPEDPAAKRAAYNAALQAHAERLGLLPDQVEGIIGLAEAIADQRIKEATGPLVTSSAEGIKRALIESGEVPPKAAPFVARWMDQAMKLDPQATMTPEGRETVLRQALGEYVLQEIRSRRRGGRPAPTPATPRPAAPGFLRPGGGPSMGAEPTADEAKVRRALGLDTKYTKYTPREGV